ncbi:hypothetical protein Slala05_70660 [Streptomyces lavendulae subsp. lavendulae]|nr:hypothetical protein Slala05_70660 [Streptomyces lavendulae subsp. lavendulae]
MVVTPAGGIHDIPAHPDPPPLQPPAGPAPVLTGPPPSLVWAAHRAGDLATAETLAHRLELDLEADHGPWHPYIITLLAAARAWITPIGAQSRQAEIPWSPPAWRGMIFGDC